MFKLIKTDRLRIVLFFSEINKYFILLLGFLGSSLCLKYYVSFDNMFCIQNIKTSTDRQKFLYGITLK